MRTLLLSLLAACLVAVPAAAQDPDSQSKSGTVQLDAGGRIEIDNHEGRITITTWDRNDVQYSAEVQQRAEPDVAKRTSVEVESSSSRLELRTVHRESDDDGWDWWGNGSDVMPVHYTLTVPRTAHVSIDDHESEMEIEGLRAELEIDTHEGSINLRDHEGRVRLESHDGPITIDRLTGKLDIETHDSDVEITGYRGALEIDNHDAEVDVEFAALDDEVEIETHDGDTTLRLPTGTGFTLDADLHEDGDLDGDFDVAGLRDDDNDYRGDVNGGGPRIRFSAHDGDLRLVRR